jgi:hypothetical protein
LHPIEIKLSSRPAPRDSRGISALRQNYPGLDIAPGLIVAPVESLEQISHHDFAVPWDLV